MTGNLGIFSLSDLLQLLSNSTQTGNLKIDHPTGEATVYFESGKIVHAELNEQTGEDAIKTLFIDKSTQDSNFSFFALDSATDSTMTSLEHTINKNTDMLLLQALGTAEEARIADNAKKLPSLAIPYFIDQDNLNDKLKNANLKLSANDIAILRLIDGQRTVQTMAIETGMNVENIKTLVQRLIENEVLAVRKPEVRVARLVIRLSDEDLSTETVAIDRKILKAWSKQLNYPITEVKCKHPNGQILHFNAEPQEKLGPYMEVSQDVLLKYKFQTDMALLVKPRRQID